MDLFIGQVIKEIHDGLVDEGYSLRRRGRRNDYFSFSAKYENKFYSLFLFELFLKSFLKKFLLLGA